VTAVAGACVEELEAPAAAGGRSTRPLRAQTAVANSSVATRTAPNAGSSTLLSRKGGSANVSPVSQTPTGYGSLIGRTT
jgi:hypothetical protein